MARNTEALGMKPTAYKTKTLNFFGGQWGTQNVHNKETGALVGLIWKQSVPKGAPRWSIAANYMVEEEHAPNGGVIGGILGRGGANTTVQLGYGNKQWGTALGYRYGQCDAGNGGGYAGGAVACGANGSDVYTQNFAVNAFWKPDETGLMPAVSAGYGWTEHNPTNVATANWMVGSTWDKVYKSNYSLNFGFGTPQYLTSGAENPGISWEASLKMKVTDNVTVVPAIFYLPEQVQGDANDSVWGGVVQTVFKF